MKFSKFNKERLFNLDTADFQYTDLESLYKKNGANQEYVLRGVYIGTKSNFSDESPIIATDNFYINLPQHQLGEIKEMLADPRAIQAINDGEAGFKIDTYFQSRFKKTCYKAVWIDVDPVREEMDNLG